MPLPDLTSKDQEMIVAFVTNMEGVPAADWDKIAQMTGQKYTRNARSAFKRVMDKIKSASTNSVDAAAAAANGDADGDATADGDDEGDNKPKKAAAKKKAPAKPKEAEPAAAPNEKKRTRTAKPKTEKPSKKVKKEEPVEDEGDLNAEHDDFYVRGEHGDDDAQAVEQLNEDANNDDNSAENY